MSDIRDLELSAEQLEAISHDRDETIAAIRAALKKRSGKPWSVTGGRGTAWGWIRISAPPARSREFGSMTAADAAELTTLLSLDRAHDQGVSVPASWEHRREYLERAHGRPVTAIAQAYWD
jgi:thioesterase domain-containing protein